MDFSKILMTLYAHSAVHPINVDANTIKMAYYFKIFIEQY